MQALFSVAVAEREQIILATMTVIVCRNVGTAWKPAQDYLRTADGRKNVWKLGLVPHNSNFNAVASTKLDVQTQAGDNNQVNYQSVSPPQNRVCSVQLKLSGGCSPSPSLTNLKVGTKFALQPDVWDSVLGRTKLGYYPRN